jgi:hypothetical protein
LTFLGKGRLSARDGKGYAFLGIVKRKKSWWRNLPMLSGARYSNRWELPCSAVLLLDLDDDDDCEEDGIDRRVGLSKADMMV